MTEPRHDRAADDIAAKDSPQAASTLSSDVLDLLAAIRDTAHVPLPGNDPADDRAWHTLMHRRLTALYVSLNVALSPQWIANLDPTAEAAHIRRRTAETPVTYTLWADPDEATDGGDDQ